MIFNNRNLSGYLNRPSLQIERIGNNEMQQGDKVDKSGLMDDIYIGFIVTEGELDEQIEKCCKKIDEARSLKYDSGIKKRTIIKIRMLKSVNGCFKSQHVNNKKVYQKHREYNIGALRGQIMIDRGDAILIV